ncbi:MAG: DUF5678 domain-containing protein [Dehalococcoidia bacterium]
MMPSYSIGTLTKEVITSIVTSDLAPDEVLKQLDSYGIEWYVTEQGNVMIRYWQIGAEDFVPAEHIARIREAQTVPPKADYLEWLSRNLVNLRGTYAGQWIAVIENQVIAASPNLPGLLEQVRSLGVKDPFVTEIPAEPTTWLTAYAR